MCVCMKAGNGTRVPNRGGTVHVAHADAADYTCPSSSHLFKSNMDFAHHVRSPLKNMVQQLCPKSPHQYVLLYCVRAGFGVVRIDPLHFLAGCRTR